MSICGCPVNPYVMAFYNYPLVFEPIFQQRIWGGDKLSRILGKHAPPGTGESWELSGVDGHISVVANGPLSGLTLSDLLERHPVEILGQNVYDRFGATFPLLFKFIDAREDLSIQVHPSDELARKRHNSFGKTEMWHIMQADPSAKITVGFKKPSDQSEYLEYLKRDKVADLLQKFEVQPGDVFMLETGTVHAIGAGVLLAEIQQTSDITYRIYDYNRVDADGRKRELHTELALGAIRYEPASALKPYDKSPNRAHLIVDCPYFTTHFVALNGQVPVRREADSFAVYMCVRGSFSITDIASRHDYKAGDTVLLPAALEAYTLDGDADLLQVTIS